MPTGTEKRRGSSSENTVADILITAIDPKYKTIPDNVVRTKEVPPIRSHSDSRTVPKPFPTVTIPSVEQNDRSNPISAADEGSKSIIAETAVQSEVAESLLLPNTGAACTRVSIAAARTADAENPVSAAKKNAANDTAALFKRLFNFNFLRILSREPVITERCVPLTASR